MINILGSIEFNINLGKRDNIKQFIEKNSVRLIIYVLSIISILSFIYYYYNGLGLAYNDARSHLDIGRRVVEGLKPGLAQLGSVWLPLPHLLMVPTIWNDFMWHSGLAGALASMISFVFTGLIIYLYSKELNVGIFGRIVAILVFVLNINVLYLQSTAMTELLILFTMTASCYNLLRWHKTNNLLDLIYASFWVMIATLTRYDGWFLLAYATVLVALHVFTRKPTVLANIFQKLKARFSEIEGSVFLFVTLGALGVILWLLWNQAIFGDALYFAFGPFSARTQQIELQNAGNLPTIGNVLMATKVYFYAVMFNSYGFSVLLALTGVFVLFKDKTLSRPVKLASTALLSPLLFNILALYMGHSVLFIQGISGNTWFNVRYGMMLMPAIAIFIGFLVDRFSSLRLTLVGLLAFVTFFAFVNADAVTIDDARVGSSQKNVSEVSDWLAQNARDKEGFVLISAASHDAIIFSSGLPMKRFIHEGTGLYWESATALPERWARWIILRTHDTNDLTFKLINENSSLDKYNLVNHFPFADIYEIKPEYLENLTTSPILGRQK